MNREEFVEQFKVGDKITVLDWMEGEQEEILLIGDVNFVTLDGCVYKTRTFHSYPFIHYKEPVKKDLDKVFEVFEVLTFNSGLVMVKPYCFMCENLLSNLIDLNVKGCSNSIGGDICETEYITKEEAIERGLKF